MMNHRILQLLFIGGLVTAATPQAAADPIRITGGSLEVGTVSGSVNLIGERDFTLVARLSNIEGNFQPYINCSYPGCAPGTAIDLLAYWEGSGLRSATVTLDEQNYAGVGSLTGSSSASVRFMGSGIVPSLADVGRIIAPFAFSGTFSYFNPMGTLVQETLEGAGTATLAFGRTSTAQTGRPPAMAFLNAHYEFQPAPEPATLILTGGGIVALLARRRRSKTGRAAS